MFYQFQRDEASCSCRSIFEHTRRRFLVCWMRFVDPREIGDSVSAVEELENTRSRVKLGYSWTGQYCTEQKNDTRSSRMPPSNLSWLQGCLFFFLGVAASYGLNRCQNRRNKHETSDAGPIAVLIDSGVTPTPIDDAQSSGCDENARPPSNLSNPLGEAMASTWSLSCPDPDRLRSKSLGHDSSSVSECFGATRQTSHFLEFVAKTEAPNFDRRETTYNTNVTDLTPSPMSSTTAGLLRSSGGEDKALSPLHPTGETMASPGTRSCPDRKRYQYQPCRMEKRSKSSFEKFIAKDEACNYRLWNGPEIPVVPPQNNYWNEYPSNNHQQMHQMYYDDVRYGNDGYHSPRHFSNYLYAPEVFPFDYNQGTEYPSHQISVNIRLSGRRFIDVNHLRIGLQREGLSCEVRGSVITLSGFPADDGANGFLALVQRISRVGGASIVGLREEEKKGNFGMKEKYE